MRQIYEKTVRELFSDFLNIEKIQPNEKVSRDRIREWFQANYPKVKRGTIDCHITRLSTNAPSRVHYNAAKDGSDDIFVQLDDKSLRLYDSENDPIPIQKDKEIDPSRLEEDEESNIADREFAYEEDLKNYLAKNLDAIEPGLYLYEEENISGIEYNAGGRYIDILAVDKNDNFVVIELKVSRGYDRVVGQLLRYIGWVKKNIAEENQEVRGIIVARTISEDLKIACSQVQNTELFEYKLSVSVDKVL